MDTQKEKKIVGATALGIMAGAGGAAIGFATGVLLHKKASTFALAGLVIGIAGGVFFGYKYGDKIK